MTRVPYSQHDIAGLFNQENITLNYYEIVTLNYYEIVTLSYYETVTLIKF